VYIIHAACSTYIAYFVTDAGSVYEINLEIVLEGGTSQTITRTVQTNVTTDIAGTNNLQFNLSNPVYTYLNMILNLED